MEVVDVVVYVVAILGGVCLIQAAIWIPVVRRWKRKRAAWEQEFAVELDAAGDHIVRGPETANYRGGTGTYSQVKGNGQMTLTEQRLVFRKTSGGLVDVPRSSITGTRRAAAFLGSRVGGQTHLVVVLEAGIEVAYFVTDLEGWEQAIRPRPQV